ncbi:MAG: HK97 gp10 family phage protein [Erysipelotrichales bacterium]|nr:HK97 gp10 family phage protein [Erysipelotrichales bacterium]
MDNLLNDINQLIQQYGTSVLEEINKRVERCADEVLEYIRKNAPRGDNGGPHLADSFIKTKVGKSIYISSQTKGPLVHLIEFGFMHTSGKFVRARPFLIPAYEEFTPKMLEDIKKIISHAN